MTMQGSITSLGDLGVIPDLALDKVLQIAGHVGDISRDDVNISYTSLLIGLLWSDDPTSLWLQSQQQKDRGVQLDAVYRQRGLTGAEREAVLAKVASGEPYSKRRDEVSISARTVLRDARSVANETGTLRTEPIGTSHVAAVYFFRNPPGHNHQLQVEWGFQPELWRRAFAEFIAADPSQATAWAPVLGSYLATESPVHSVPGSELVDYLFDAEAQAVLRTAEERGTGMFSGMMTSEDLLHILAGAKTVRDALSFREVVGDRLGSDEIALSGAATAGDTFSANATHGFKNILVRARNLTRAVTGTEAIGVRHLIASIILEADSTANRLLVDAGVSVPLLRQKLLYEFTRRWVNDDGIQWRFHLIGTTPPLITGYSADQADSGDDKLDVARFATAFAVVIAADGVRPPLSIGVFGDWGSGKSFFMRLISDQADKLCAIETKDADGRRLFCRRVVPIRFNAWHYAERDLWASLVQTIFRELRAALVGKEDESDLMETVLNQLEVAKVARKAAEKEVEDAQQARDLADRQVQSARAEAQRKADAVKTASTADVVAALRATVITDVRIEKAATVVQQYLGMQGVGNLARQGSQTGADVMDFIDRAEGTLQQARSGFDWLLRAPVERREVLLLCGVSAAVLGVGGALAIGFHDQIGTAWPAVSAGIVEALAIAGLVTKWAKQHLGTISQGLDEFQAARLAIDRKIAERRSTRDGNVAAAEGQAALAATRLREAEAALQAADEQVRLARQKVEDSRSLNRIAKLVEQRLTGRDYEQYLGIIDAIRKDFQTLSTLMRQMRDEGVPENASLQPVDRIVLYIDDLDRCPSKQVVAVLEAIHLLLTFELFVVVVGVDVRWAAHSLNEHYPRHLSTGRYEGAAGTAASAAEPVDAAPAGGDGATALDYLEKIFQIPFWLPPMDEQSSRNMLADLLPRPRDTEVDAAEEHGGDGAVETKEIPKVAQPAAKPQLVSGPIVSRSKAESLVIESPERSYLLGLAAAVGKSPRRLKRFVNTYRVLKGSIDALERETFVLEGGSAGEYRAAAALLAVMTGAPDSSLALTRALADANDNGTVQEFVSYAEALALVEERPYVDSALRAYVEASNDPDLRLRDLRYWMPRVMRFSFRSGRS